MATDFAYAVPEGSFDFWIERFEKHKVSYSKPAEKFGEPYLPFQNPDDLKLELVIPKDPDNCLAWETSEINAELATKRFHGVTLTLRNIKATAAILIEIIGYKLVEQSGNRYRYPTDTVDKAAIIDLVELSNEAQALGGAGTNHHIAFRIKDEDKNEQEGMEQRLFNGRLPLPCVRHSSVSVLYFRSGKIT